MTKFDRGTQKVHGKLSKLSLGYIKGIPFFVLSIKRYIKGTEKVQNIVPFLYLISVWEILPFKNGRLLRREQNWKWQSYFPFIF